DEMVGIYPNYRGVPVVGALKIGLIALERKPHLTNAVIGDPRVNNQEWAKREGMVAFAGYPLIVEDNLIGVMAMFSRKKVEESVLKSLGAVADIIALGIQQKQTEHKMGVLSESLEVRVTERTELLARTNEALQSEIADRKKIEVEIRQAKSELEWRNRVSRLLIQMGDNLHVCNKAEEAYAAIDQSARQLFPDDSGALFIFNASRNLLEVVFAFGEAIPGEKYYAPDDCWALRKGQLHMVLGSRPVMHCKYFETVTGNYICAPIISQSEIVGVFHLILGQNSIVKSDEYWLEAKKTLTERMVERIGSALSNLKLREKLRDLSIHDPLTGLFNRRYMNELLERELCRAERKKLPLCVIMIDIDHFKQFNDTFGHDAGDAVLHDLGLFLQEYIRGSDIAYRYGGEEFVIILPDASGEVARNRADQLRKAIKQMRVHDKGQCLGVITISLGVAVFPENGVTAESLLKAADGALYRAKQAGRDRVCVAWEE
ncbi:MAG TPA: diguanylate cyclase, partial [Candidatus Wunengus sp. YC60]|uniref:diguanylate cyclase n=1 Tax=Candidatus Wunengus sp. YC60 TaxID=3367697 RepID=UPI0040264991